MERYKDILINFNTSIAYRYKVISDRDSENSSRIQDFINRTSEPYHRKTPEGHVTATAFIVDNNHQFSLMLFHNKLSMWLPPGGHCDNDPNAFLTAIREAREETGIQGLNTHSDEIFDIDIHIVPENNTEAEHLHYDVRFLFTADMSEPLKLNEDEASEVEWIHLDELDKYNLLPSIQILRKKLELI